MLKTLAGGEHRGITPTNFRGEAQSQNAKTTEISINEPLAVDTVSFETNEKIKLRRKKNYPKAQNGALE